MDLRLLKALTAHQLDLITWSSARESAPTDNKAI